MSDASNGVACDGRPEVATGPSSSQHHKRRIAVFISCDSFEGFYGGTFGLDRKTFLTSYRNDFVWEYAEGLRGQGHVVVIYILSYGSPELVQVGDGLSVRFLALPMWLRIVDAGLYRVRRGRVGRTLRDRVAYVGYAAELRAALLRDAIDILYNQEVWTPRFDIVARVSPIPVVGADHGAVYADWMAAAKRLSVARASRIVCQSTTTADLVRRLGGSPVLMSNAVDTDFFVPPPSRQRRGKSVLAVGRLVEEQKRFSDLLAAMQLLPDFSLVLVGSGPDEARLRKLVLEVGLQTRVSFAGFVSDRTELRRLYQQCGAFVSSSKWEAMALVVLEAMSCGAPVVATRIPSFEDLLTDDVDGLLVSVGAPEQIARAVRAAHARQQEIGDNARATVVARYSSHALYRKLSDLLQAI